jgi:hypothetical protein
LRYQSTIAKIIKEGGFPASALRAAPTNKSLVANVTHFHATSPGDRTARTVGENSRSDVYVVGAACASAKEHNTSMLMTGTGKTAALVRDMSRDEPTRQEVTLYHFPTLLRTVYGKNKPKIRMLKIDTVGADAQILIASEDIFKEKLVDVVVFEVNQMVSKFSVNYTQAVAMLQRHGYTTYMVGAISHNPVRIGLFEIGMFAMEEWPYMLDTMVGFANEEGFLVGPQKRALEQSIAVAARFVNAHRAGFRRQEAMDCPRVTLKTLPKCFGRFFMLRKKIGGEFEWPPNVFDDADSVA